MTFSRVFLVLATVTFVLAAFGVSFDAVEILPIGLAFFAVAGLTG